VLALLESTALKIELGATECPSNKYGTKNLYLLGELHIPLTGQHKGR
jgi:hypothetical protein